jgi:hypothetical protein
MHATDFFVLVLSELRERERERGKRTIENRTIV